MRIPPPPITDCRQPKPNIPDMSFLDRYAQAFARTGSRLCVGLDTDLALLPSVVREADDPMLAFNQAIVDATADLAIAYKPNLAFYEAAGQRGMDALRQTLAAIPPHVIKIADAKRGDIGNTAERYAQAFFEAMPFDAITLNPYMGTDTLKPYFKFEGTCKFVLALTSNPGSQEFQRIESGGKPIYLHVIDRCLDAFASTGDLGFVVGATHPEELARIREHVGPDIPLLIPGVGAQGGDAAAVMAANNGGAAFINVSRGIIAASKGDDFAQAARAAALKFAEELRDGVPAA